MRRQVSLESPGGSCENKRIANVDQEQLSAYLERYETTFRETVETHIGPDLQAQLERYPLIGQRLRGYVSTSFGVAYEYFDEPRTQGIETEHGSAPVDQLVFRDAPPGVRKRHFFVVDGENCRVMGGTYDGAIPVHLSSTAAECTLSDMTVEGGTWSRTIRHMELYGNRSADRWSEIEAVNRAKDEVLVALLDQNRLQIRHLDLGEYLEQFKERVVLVLGDFTEGRARLDAICGALKKLGYEPVLLDEVPDGLDYDLSQKFTAVAHVSRFLVFDDSSSAGQLWEMAGARGSGLVRLVLREQGRQSSWMSAGQELTSKVVRECEYTLGDLDATIESGVAWAEEYLQTLATARAGLYPWRRPPTD